MRKLSDTLTRLAALRAVHGQGQAPGVSDRLTDLASFGSNPGALRARLHVPAGLAPGSPLVVVLHGCTQSAAAYDHGSGWSTLADSSGFAALFPEQVRANNANLCFNWFEPGDTKRGSGEALSIRQMIAQMVKDHALDEQRVFITGLSAGGAMTSAMLATYPEVFAGGAIVAGLPYGVAESVPQAFDRMRGHGGPSGKVLAERVLDASDHKGPWPTVSVWHGTADATVSLSNAGAIVDQWRGVHALPASPTQTSIVDGHRRNVWHGPQGQEHIQLFTIDSMGHGTPIQASGMDQLGHAGPFMLDQGISSTRHIARSWGIASPAEATTASPPGSRPLEPTDFAHTSEMPPPASPTGSPRAGGASGHSVRPDAIRSVIESALRQAGLMK
jgi:poly(hydroxyalkanoate) depolymerase family esterase